MTAVCHSRYPGQARPAARLNCQDRNGPGGGRGQLGYPERQQIGRSTHCDQHPVPARQCHGPHDGNAEQHLTDCEQDRQPIDVHHSEDDLVTSTLLTGARTAPQ